MSEIWSSTRVGDCCDILDSLRIPLNAEEREDIQGNIPYYGANGLQGYIDKFLFDEPLILLAEDGGYFDEYESRPIAYRIRGKSWVNNHAHILRTKVGGSFSQAFVFYCIEHKNLMPFIKGGTRAKLNQAELREILIPKPPEPIQRRIAEILSTVDEAIEHTEALIEKYQQIKAGLMHDLFTRGVTPDGHLRPTQAEAPHLYNDSPLGWIPKEWEVGELRRWLIYLSYGFTNPMPESDEGPYMVTAADINADRIQYDTCRRTTRDAFDRLLTQKSRPKVGDVLLTKDGTLGRIALVDRLDVCINQSVAVLRPADTRHSQFIASMLSAPMWQQKMLSDAGGSTIKHIYITVVSKMLVAWPSRSEELEAISARIESCTAMIECEEDNLEKLRQQKRGLMHDLLTGRVRVNVGESASA